MAEQQTRLSNVQRFEKESEQRGLEDTGMVPRTSNTSNNSPRGKSRRKEVSEQMLPQIQGNSSGSLYHGQSQEEFPQTQMGTITEKSDFNSKDELKSQLKSSDSNLKKASISVDKSANSIDIDPLLSQNLIDFDLIKQQLLQGEQKFHRIQQAFRLEKEKKDAAESMVALLYLELKRLKELSMATRMVQKKELLEKEVQLLEIKKQELSHAGGVSQQANNEALDKLIVAVEAMQTSLPPPAQQFSVMDNILKQLNESVRQQRIVLSELREEIQALEKVKGGLEEDNKKLVDLVSKQQHEQAESNVTSIDGLMTKIETGFNVKSPAKSVAPLVSEEASKEPKAAAPLARKKGTIKIVGDALQRFMLPQSPSHQEFSEQRKEPAVPELSIVKEPTSPEPAKPAIAETKKRSKSVSAKMVPGQLHQFVPHTFRSPKKCHYCNETMWGKEFKCEGRMEFNNSLWVQLPSSLLPFDGKMCYCHVWPSFWSGNRLGKPTPRTWGSSID